MSFIKEVFGSLTTITCTLASLANNAAREAAAIDNSAARFLDAMIYGKLKLQAGSPSNDFQANIYFYASADGSNYTDNASGSDAALTMRVPTNFFGAFIVATPDAGALTYKFVIPSVASYFGGVLPYKWGIVVENKTGIALSATPGDHSVAYVGIYDQII
jgi:hypothetical protein